MIINKYVSNTLQIRNEVFILKKHNDFTYNDGDAAENHILNSIKKCKDISSDSRELETYIKDWPSLYHLSRERALAYGVLEITPSTTILEVGSGCGSITRFLGERAAWVLALEGSFRRAAITRERTRDLGNVNVLCASFEDVVFTKKFDIVVCNGVFEYAAMFTKGEEPCQRMLARLSSLVAPGGALIMAIENQLGLRYFSSGKEEHTNIMYDGIEGYPSKPRGVQTFGAVELEQMLRASFDSVETLIPLPDYKLPTAIIRDKLLEFADCAELFANTARYDYGSRILPKMHERLVWHELQKNSLLKTFSNSFFVIAGDRATNLLSPDWLGCIYSIRRNPEWAAQTTIYAASDGTVQTKKSYHNPELPRAGEFPFTHHEGRGTWIDGQSVHTAIVRALCRKGQMPLTERLREPVKAWWEAIEKIAPALEEDQLGGRVIDCNWQNTIIGKNGIEFIDNEWSWDGDIDKLWLIYRAVLNFTKDETLFVHRWNKNFRLLSAIKIIKAVSSILEVDFTIAKLANAIVMENIFQKNVLGVASPKKRAIFRTVEPILARQIRHEMTRKTCMTVNRFQNYFLRLFNMITQ